MSNESWEYAGISLSSHAWQVEAVMDGLGTPGLRGSDVTVPFRNGRIRSKKRYNDRVITLGIWVRGVDPATGTLGSKTALEWLDINIDTLTALFGRRGDSTLKRYMRDGTVRTASAEIQSPFVCIPKQPGYAKATVDLALADPFFYGSTLSTTEKTLSSSPLSWTQTPAGTAEVTASTITLTGPLTSPKIENLTTGIWLQYNGTILTGETVIIDTAKYTCTKGGVNMIGSIRHAGDPSWMILSPGGNALRLSSDATGGKCKIEYYPAYL